MEGSSCHKSEQCLDISGEPYIYCPVSKREQRQHIKDPNVLAESLCIEALQSVAETRAKNPIKEKLDEVWRHLERAIALPELFVDDFKDYLFASAIRGIKQLHFDEQKVLKKNQADISASEVQYLLQARILGLHIPAFGVRIKGNLPNSQLMEQLHTTFGMFLRDYDQRYLGTVSPSNYQLRQKILSLRTEHEIDLLLSGLHNQNYFPHLASPREESSTTANKNHDRYVINQGRKIGIQIKNSSTATSNGVVVIQHYDILHAMRREPIHIKDHWLPKIDSEEYEWPTPYEYQQIIKGSRPDPLAALLVEELEQGRLLEPGKRKALQLARLYVTSRIDQVQRAQN